MSAGEKGSKGEFWRWSQRQPKAASRIRSMLQLTSDGSGAFSEARRSEAVAAAAGGDAPADFVDTIPEVGRYGAE